MMQAKKRCKQIRHAVHNMLETYDCTSNESASVDDQRWIDVIIEVDFFSSSKH